MIAQREPELQRAKPTREFHRLFKEREALNGVRTELFRIATCVAERPSGNFSIAIQETSAIERLIQPFVRIKGK